MGEIKAIETRYKGYRFRSRLEARWAVFFDAMGYRWEYEPEGFVLPDGQRYLPDFFLHFHPEWSCFNPYPVQGFFCEVKPCLPTEEEGMKLLHVTEMTHHHHWFLVGEPGRCVIGKWRSMSGFDKYFYNDPNPDVDDEVEAPWILHNVFHQLGPVESRNVRVAIELSRSARFEHGEKP